MAAEPDQLQRRRTTDFQSGCRIPISIRIGQGVWDRTVLKEKVRQIQRMGRLYVVEDRAKIPHDQQRQLFPGHARPDT